jgi:hypothetical protein
MANTNTKIEGGCFCGDIRYQATSVPLGSMVCHCQSCRRTAGAPVVAWVTFPKDRFSITRGKPAEFSSSSGVLRTHCARCGTSLTFQGPKFPDEIDVTTATLDNAGAFPPTHHSWLADDLPWVKVGDGLPTYPRSKGS